MSRRDMGITWDLLVRDHDNDGSDGDGFSTYIQRMLMTPEQIVQELDKSVIGQESAKQLTAIAAFSRLIALNNYDVGRVGDEYYFEKNNILLIGGTGCGKTHMIKALSRAVSLPCTIQDASTFSATGYVGRKVEDCVKDLIEESFNMVRTWFDRSMISEEQIRELAIELASYGIIYVDEADKIASNNSTNDVSGRRVQEAFLKLVEGTSLKIKSNVYFGNFDTSNILFVFGGAFSDMRKIIETRLDVSSMGFNGTLKSEIESVNLFQQSNNADFIKFGMIPELMGRLSTVAVLKDLNTSMIKRILVEPDRSILSQVINEFKSFGIFLSFTDDAIELIVNEAQKLKLGARGLKSVVQQLMRPLYYYLPSNAVGENILVTSDMLNQLKERGL